VPKLEVAVIGREESAKGREIFACAFTPDSGLALTGSWDGQLRLWDGMTGAQITSLQAGNKPLSACAVSPNGRHWLSGSMDGIMVAWDAVSHQQLSLVAIHTRPISGIAFANDSQTLATASWDKKLTVRNVLKIRDGQTLSGHEDIVAGCRFLPDMTHLMSWSHDGTIRLWDISSGKTTALLRGHQDRVNHAAVSPDGRFIASVSRDRQLILRAWQQDEEVKSIQTDAEIRGLFFLPDSNWLVTADQEGWLTLYSVPHLETEEELETKLAIQCAELSPSGTRLVLGGEDGRIMFINVEGVEPAPIPVTAKLSTRHTKSGLMRVLGKIKVKHTFSCTCPVCRQSFELQDSLPGQPAPCPNCRQTLRFSAVEEAAQGQ
jgi:WD40 repeat protein